MSGEREWLADEDLDRLRSLGARRRLPAGTTVFSEGDESSEVVLVVSGSVKVTTTAMGGREVVLELVGEGELLGELSTIDGSPRSATATTLTPVELVAVPSDRFTAFLDERPQATRGLLAVVIGRLRQSNRRQLEYATSDALGRLCGRLTELAERGGAPVEGGVRVELPISQSELAQWCGLSREAVVKALRALRQLGWITTDDGTVTILDVDAVRTRAAV